jgi:hypothetical protein
MEKLGDIARGHPVLSRRKLAKSYHHNVTFTADIVPYNCALMFMSMEYGDGFGASG